MELSLLLEFCLAIGSWNLELVLDLFPFKGLWTIDEGCEHGRFAATCISKGDNDLFIIGLFDMSKNLFASGDYIPQVEVLVARLLAVPQVGKLMLRLHDGFVRFLKHFFQKD